MLFAQLFAKLILLIIYTWIKEGSRVSDAVANGLDYVLVLLTWYLITYVSDNSLFVFIYIYKLEEWCLPSHLYFIIGIYYTDRDKNN